MVKETQKQNEGYGIIGLTLGILSILLFGSNGIFIAIVGFIFSMVQQKRHPTKFGKAGIILNIIGFILAALLIISLLTWLRPILESQIGNFPIQ